MTSITCLQPALKSAPVFAGKKPTPSPITEPLAHAFAVQYPEGKSYNGNGYVAGWLGGEVLTKRVLNLGWPPIVKRDFRYQLLDFGKKVMVQITDPRVAKLDVYLPGQDKPVTY